MISEVRCAHGFLRSVAPCSICGRGERLRKAPPARALSVSDDDIEAAFRKFKSVTRSARELGISKTTVLARVAKNERLLETLNELRSTVGARPFRHPGFIDLSGKTIAGVVVLERLENQDGNAYWLCRFGCGHERPVKGTELRDRERHGGNALCHECPVRKIPRRKKATAA